MKLYKGNFEDPASVIGTDVSANFLTPSEAVAAGQFAGVIDSQQWATVEGYRVDTPACHSRGLPLQDFATWAAAHRAAIDVGPPAR